MNQFVFCVELESGKIEYGYLKAWSGDKARAILESRLETTPYKRLSIAGITSCTVFTAELGK